MVAGTRDGGTPSRPTEHSSAAPSILATQMLGSAAALSLIVVIVLFSPAALTSISLFSGLGLLFAITGLAALVPWDRVARGWRILLPLLNIVAIAAVRQAAPQFGAGLLMVFPVIWLARSFSALQTAIGTGFAIVIVWASRILIAPTALTINDFGSLVLLPIVLVFIAVSVYFGARRARAQSVILRDHSRMIEGALARVRREQQLLDEVLNAVDFGVIAFDGRRQVTLVNRAQRRALADFGAPPNAVVHPVVYQADRVTPYPQEERPFARAIAGQSFDNLVVWVGEPGGRRAAYSVSARQFRDDGGGVIVLKDVTRELDAVRARDDLVGSVTHELRSPLTSILGYLDLAREEDGLTDETRHMLDVASGNAERLLVLVTDLLRTAADAEKNLPMSFVLCDLSEITRESVDEHRLFAEEREVELEFRSAGAALALADPVRIRQVVDNLVTNSIKYNREWGEVVVEVVPGEQTVVISVRDSGQGIPEGDLARIFDRFYRTKSARNSDTVGSGLGLAITREIVNRHGGELSVESELGIGSVFRVTIPTDRSTVVLDEHSELHPTAKPQPRRRA